ncbi:uncharacterized protein DFR76_101979 [Nocardia pseudobrasiliensis]|uniref:DUF418 domain-containing protein n=2 Tax=Nocardia pseudobrasiliensis TaxID=45979 RepID=A0A370IFD7_9NOCA|nr:uncharacterized protein DFR76_101979 [Nocardia pseudobrasiliensis]
MLRGFALFGILITNAVVLVGLLTSDHAAVAGQLWQHDGVVDRVTDAVVSALFLGRFFLLFSFLFGYSFTLQLEAARRANVSGPRRLVRRCLALFVIGLAHVLLLWVGDILTLYAGLCLILLLLRWIGPRTAVVIGTVLVVGFALLSFLPSDGDLPVGDWLGLSMLRDGYAGGPLDTLRAQLHVGPRFMALTWLSQGIPSLGMFLLGLAAGKAGLFRDRERLRRWVPRAMWVGFGLGLPISAITFVQSTADAGAIPEWSMGLQELVNPLMTFAYLALILHLAHTPRWSTPISWLAPAGRMAATNYIGQSVALMLLYSGYGLSARIPISAVVALGLLTFALQLAFSRWWLTTHTYGPIEWLLRAATYLTRPQWRTREPIPGK